MNQSALGNIVGYFKNGENFKGSLFFAYLCCVLNQFLYILGLWGRRLRSFISMTSNYIHILPPTQVPQSTEHPAHVIQQRGLRRPSGIPPPCAPGSPASAFTILASDLKVGTSQASDASLITFYSTPVPDLLNPHLLWRKMSTKRDCGKILKREHSNFEKF